MITKQEIQKVNKRLSKFLDPIEFKEPMPTESHEMAFGLAQMYAVKGFRDYMENEILRTIKASVLGSETMSEVLYFKARALVFKELLSSAKKAYLNMEALSQKAKNQRPNATV